MDDANTNKQLRIYDETGKFIRVSVDEAIANKYNYWKDWKCSAGIRGLYIDYDGNIWICNSASSNHKQKLYEYHKIKFETVMPTISKEKKAEKIKELKEINNLIDLQNSDSLKIKRDQIISEIEEELVKLNDFENWKEWKN